MTASRRAKPQAAATKAASGRINARFAPMDELRVRELAAHTRMSTSEVLREAVREYHVKHIKPKRSAYEIMLESGFIGCGKRADKPIKDKNPEFTAALKAKYPQHFKD